MVSSSRPQPHHSSSSFGNSSAASTILGAFGRRPRTATNSRDRQGLPTDYADSNEDLRSSSNSNNNGNRSRISLVSRAGIPRSNSSSHIHRMSPQDSSNSSSRFAFPSSSAATDEGMRAPAMAAQNSSGSMTNANRPSRQGAEAFPGMTRTQSSQGGGGSSSNGGGGGAFGRYFRRYSQGAGKNMAAAQEAHSIAAASNSSRQSGGGSNDAAAALAPTRAEGGSSSTNSYIASPGATSSMSASQTAPSLLSAAVAAHPIPSAAPARATEAALPPVPSTEATAATNHRLRLVPHLEATRSLHFEPIERDLVEGAIAVRIGRFTDRSAPPAGAADSAIAAGGGSAAAGVAASGSDGEGNNAGANVTSSAVTTAGPGPGPGSGSVAGPSGMTASTSTGGMPGARGGAIMSSAGGGGRVDSGRIAFKSKVVSRGHAEVWCEAGGKFFIRDTKSSSGTFLNHIRLSHPNLESKPFPLKDGDVVQLGVDYQGGTEEIYRCVKMRVELNRGWQRGANQFNVNALRQLRALQGSPMPEPAAASPAGGAKSAAAALPTNRQSMNVTDCCICLFSVTVCQALFIAPCSHVFHFKCIRPLIEQHHPGFCCPLCRTFADLDADVEEDEAWQQALLQEAQMGPGFPAAVEGPMDVSTPMAEEPALNFSSGGPPLATGVSMQSLDAVLPVLDSSSIEGEDASSRRPSSLRRAVLGTMGSDDDHLASTHERYHSPSNSSNAHSVEGHTGQQRHTTSNAQGPQVAASEGEEAQEVMYDAPALLQGVPLHLRRPSAPISIRGAATSSSSATMSQAHRSPTDGFIQSPSFLDARTPQNEHFLSTLAEAPPPSRSALQAMDQSVNTIGDNTLFPGSILDSSGGERRESNATNNSSLHAETGDAYTTPAQGNSPPTGSSPLSDEEGNGETNTAGSSAAVHSVASSNNTSNNNAKGKTAADSTTAPPSSVKNGIDFLSGQHGTGSARRTRESSGVDSVESSDRGSSRDGGKVARFFKRNSTTFGN